MALIIISPPSTEPITVAEAKASPSLRVAVATDDTDIGTLITTARMQVEDYTNHALITQTWELVLDGFPSGGIVLPLPPLQSVTSIKYIDTDGTQQTLSSSLYDLDSDTEPGMVAPAYGESWPSTRDEINAVRVRYVAGFGAASDVPEDIKTCIKFIVGVTYDNSQGIIGGQQMIPLDDIIEKILRQYVKNYRYKAIQF
jgi:uncharacterized phiE125 gp8 family phage protein